MVSIVRRPLAVLTIALLIPVAPLAATGMRTAHAAVTSSDGLACSVYAKLRGPYFNGETFQAEPNIDANINQMPGTVNHHLLYSQPNLGPGPTQRQGSVNSFNVMTISCGREDSAFQPNVLVGSITVRGTAGGASGAFTYGDRITTTFSMNGSVVQAMTTITDSTGAVLKGSSTAQYNAGPNGMLVINNAV